MKWFTIIYLALIVFVSASHFAVRSGEHAKTPAVSALALIFVLFSNTAIIVWAWGQ